MCVCVCVCVCVCGGGGVHTEGRRYEVFVILRDGLMVQHKMLQRWGEGGGWREEEEEEEEEGVGSLLHL